MVSRSEPLLKDVNLFTEALTKLGGLGPSPGDSHSVGPGRCLLEASVRCQCPPPPHRPQPTGDSHLCLGLRTTGKAGASLLLGHPAVRTEADRKGMVPLWSKCLGCAQSLIHSSVPLTMYFGHFFFFFLAMLCGTWALSPPTRDRTLVPCNGSMESQPLDCQGSQSLEHFCAMHSSGLVHPGRSVKAALRR